MTEPARILVVDDDPGIRDVITYALKGYAVDAVGDAEAAADAMSRPYDLVVLDLMLPGRSGLDLCRSLRESGNIVPVLMLTAKDAEVDRVLGLEVGADDYVTKPFSTAELVGRVRAILRRREYDRSGAQAVRQVGAVTIDFARHDVRVGGEPVRVTPSEFRLLALLSESPGEVLSRRAILQRLWDTTYVPDEHAADVHVSNLRRKIERDPAQPERLVTVRGFGYKLVG